LRAFKKQKVENSGIPCGKYAKLAEDLKAAAQYALEAVKNHDDGGTSNYDAPAIILPRWNRLRIEHAAKYAGSRCFFWNFGKSYVFSVPNVGQGFRRTRAAEAMRDYLREAGYDAGMYYQMD
jgi:hypothetical protein